MQAEVAVGPAGELRHMRLERWSDLTDDRSYALIPYLTKGEAERTFGDAGSGFTVPAPVRTDQGWTIPVTQRPDDTPEWREAAFVSCRPANVHLTGDLVLGGRTEAEVEAFTACMRRQGYELAAPSRAGAEYTFDLRGTAFDTDSDAFHRAVFVGCHPGT